MTLEVEVRLIMYLLFILVEIVGFGVVQWTDPLMPNRVFGLFIVAFFALGWAMVAIHFFLTMFASDFGQEVRQR